MELLTFVWSGAKPHHRYGRAKRSFHNRLFKVNNRTQVLLDNQGYYLSPWSYSETRKMMMFYKIFSSSLLEIQIICLVICYWLKNKDYNPVMLVSKSTYQLYIFQHKNSQNHKYYKIIKIISNSSMNQRHGVKLQNKC